MGIGIGHKILYYLEEVDDLVRGGIVYPVTCEIDLTNRCQLRCEFCIYHNYLDKNRVDLDWNIYKNLLLEMRKLGVKSITFTGGGEPLLYKQFDKASNLALNHGFEIGLVTNGILIEKHLPVLQNFKFVRISFDAGTPETYKKIKGKDRFYDVLRGASALSDSGYSALGFSMVLTEDNHHEIADFKWIAKQYGGIYAQVKPAWKLCDIEKTTEDVNPKDVFITERYSVNQRSMLACQIAGLIGQVSATGHLYYCCVNRGNNQFIIGDLKEDSFSNIMKKRRNFNPDLRHCGSCRYMNYAKVYEQVRDNQFTILRHKRFL